MSVEAMSWVFANSQAAGNDYVVLLALADHADEAFECYPGRKSLARKARVSEATVKRCLSRLVDLGELEIVEHGGGRASNRYRLTRPDPGQIDPGSDQAEIADPGQIDPAGGSPLTRQGGHPCTPRGVTAVTHESSCNRHRTIIEPSTVAGDAHAPDPPPSFDDYWAAYPHKVEKDPARKAWRKLDDDDKRACLAAVGRYVAFVDAERAGGFDLRWRGGAVFINKRTWEDDLEPRRSTEPLPLAEPTRGRLGPPTDEEKARIEALVDWGDR